MCIRETIYTDSMFFMINKAHTFKKKCLFPVVDAWARITDRAAPFNLSARPVVYKSVPASPVALRSV
jgi:hypothetical protein